MSEDTPTFDAVVIGAGFGGLGAALALAEKGARVCVLEALNYPGGCASTFKRGAYQFEAGATLFSGFGEGQLFRKILDRHGLDVTVDFLDPVVELRVPGRRFGVPARRDELVARFLEMPGAPAERLVKFFATQRKVADLLWEILDDPALLPPWSASALMRHVGKAPRYLGLLPLLGQPLAKVLASHGLDTFEPLTTFLDALCQITIQCSAREAEAPFALATMDYYFRGTGHVRGGIGTLAWALVKAIRALGGEVRLASAARKIEAVRGGGGYVVESRKGPVRARSVIANLLPQTVGKLLGEGSENLARLGERVESGWGACMLYVAARRSRGGPAAHQPLRHPAGLGGPTEREVAAQKSPDTHGSDGPCHVEIVQDVTRPFIEGNHLFCSISGPHDEGRAPEGERTITVSTHVPMKALVELPLSERASHVAAIQERMREGLAAHLPEWWEGRVHEMTASPRTFERFTGRHLGLVGGVPRRAGLHNYGHLGPTEVAPGLYLVGDSVFPGQSTLATALSGVKAAERVSIG